MFCRRSSVPRAVFGIVCASLLAWTLSAAAQDVPAADATQPPAKSAAPASEAAAAQAKHEAALAKLLTGATLEGSYTNTAGGNAPDRLRSDKYTLGEVKKLRGNMWEIQAKIQYRNSDAVMIPLVLPIEWAGDTPVIVVNDFTIPGMGTFSARVMFFANHYVGYWKHDERGGHMFGIVHAAEAAKPAAEKTD
jgi:hypothetical protein